MLIRNISQILSRKWLLCHLVYGWTAMQPLPCTTPATFGPNNMAITKESDLDPQGRQQDLEQVEV